MKRLLSILSFLFCVSLFSYGQGVSERPINGYFYINNNRTVDFFLIDDPRVDYTETGVKAGVPFQIYITEPTTGTITWQTLSSVSGTYMSLNANNGHLLSFVTGSRNGILVLLGTDDSGNQITITVHITDGGLS